MNEGPNKPPERIADIPIKAETVSARLKEQGIDSPEVSALLIEWAKQQEARVERGELSYGEKELEAGMMYRDAGLIESALETFKYVQIIADNSRDHELYWAAQDEIDELEGTPEEGKE